jgi:hypothetical protein
MNVIYDTKNYLLTSEFAYSRDRFMKAMNYPIDKLDGRDKIHWRVKSIYDGRKGNADFLLYAVHIVIFHDRGEHTEKIEKFLQLFNLCRWEGLGLQDNERVAYQGWVNGYALKVISSEGVVAGIFQLENAKEITILEGGR